MVTYPWADGNECTRLTSSDWRILNRWAFCQQVSSTRCLLLWANPCQTWVHTYPMYIITSCRMVLVVVITMQHNVKGFQTLQFLHGSHDACLLINNSRVVFQSVVPEGLQSVVPETNAGNHACTDKCKDPSALVRPDAWGITRSTCAQLNFQVLWCKGVANHSYPWPADLVLWNSWKQNFFYRHNFMRCSCNNRHDTSWQYRVSDSPKHEFICSRRTINLMEVCYSV